MNIYFSTNKEDALKKAKEGFMEKDLIFTTDLAYAKQTAKTKGENPVIMTLEKITNVFVRTKAKKETYKNIVRFLVSVTVEEL